MATNTPREGYDTFLRLVLTWPEMPHGYQLEVGRVYHTAYLHDAWCCTNYGAPASHCNCNPVASRHV